MSKLEFLEQCPICHSDTSNSRIVLTTPCFRKPEKELYTYVQCINCGLIFQNPRIPEEEIGKYYNDTVFIDTSFNKISEWVIKKRTLREIKGYNKILNKTTSIQCLEIGAGSGNYLNLLKKYGGYQVSGIEPNKKSRDFARERYQINLKNQKLSQSNIEKEKFDIVVMRHVLEHLHDPILVAKMVQTILKPRGIFVVEVPLYDTLESKIFSKYWVGFEPPVHLFVFSESNLQQLLKKAGFNIISKTFGWAPNHFITSIFNYFNINSKPRLAKFFNLRNDFLLILFSPITIFLSLVGQTGRIRIISQKT